MTEWIDIVAMDWTMRVVLSTVSALGAAAGAVGTFVLLRRRALLGDVMSHAALPGVAGAFLICAALGEGRVMWALAVGAAISALSGAWLVSAIRRHTRLKDDAAMAIVLGCGYGLGVVILSIVQSLPTGSQAGLTSVLLGRVASMTTVDLWSVCAGAVVVGILCILLFKEWRLLCFDESFAMSIGYPVKRLDALLMLSLCIIIVVGMQAAGLLVVVAFLIVPAAAARACTARAGGMLIIASSLGALSGAVGSAASAAAPDLPAGALCVIVAAGFFTLAVMFGPAEGAVWRMIRRARLESRVRSQHLLRALFEVGGGDANAPVAIARLMQRRSWSGPALDRLIRRAQRRKLVTSHAGAIQLTPRGLTEARRVVRNHRLWELYLVRFADIAPSHVDRDADQIEHILPEPLVAQLIIELDGDDSESFSARPVPASIHPIERGST
ncbi:MAG: metal ABC transporter permease [Planctomycetota bacterium]|nr:metal ABC transporter permease [Planctomycetota bacterium]